MGLDVSKLTASATSFVSKTAQTLPEALSKVENPIETGKLTSALDGLATMGTSLVKKAPKTKLLDESIEILPECSPRFISETEELLPDKLLLVHATDYFPENGIIKTTANATKEAEGVISPRFKVHSAVNHFVESHLLGDWKGKEYSILMPMDGVMQINPKDNILGGEIADFFIQGDVKLPKGTIIIKNNCIDIPKGQFRISSLGNQNGIRLVETSRTDTPEFTNELIKKMGYSKLSPDMTESTYKIPESLTRWADFTKKTEYY